MSINAPIQQSTTNFLVPAGGTTHAVQISGVFSATPYFVDWRQWKVDAFPFQPQGCYIDNTAGTSDLTLTIQPLGWRVVVPAGSQRAASFPAPNGQTATITGDPANSATVVFVDFPVFPDTDSAVTPVSVPASAPGGVPYNVKSQAPSPVYGSTVALAVTTASADAALTATANGNVLLTNAGPNLCFINLTVGAGVAAANDLPLAPNASIVVAGNAATHFSAICGTGTAILYATLEN